MWLFVDLGDEDRTVFWDGFGCALAVVAPLAVHPARTRACEAHLVERLETHPEDWWSGWVVLQELACDGSMDCGATWVDDRIVWRGVTARWPSDPPGTPYRSHLYEGERRYLAAWARERGPIDGYCWPMGRGIPVGPPWAGSPGDAWDP